MKIESLTAEEKSKLIFRLTALWALNESGLGGIMHALQIPFTGIVLGGISILIVTLILFFAENKTKSIFNALLIVLVIKFTLSPHSNPAAYIAVSFQAVFGWITYGIFGINVFTILLSCIITFFESATQKVLTLTILGGFSFWVAVDEFVDKTVKIMTGLNFHSGVILLLSTYFLIYFVFAILFAYIIIQILKRIKISTLEQLHFSLAKNYVEANEEAFLSKDQIKRKRIKLVLFLFLLTLPLIMLWNNHNLFIHYILRTGLIVVIWYFVLLPMLTKLLSFFFNKRKTKQKFEVETLMQIFPDLKEIILFSWNESKDVTWNRRIPFFINNLIIRVLFYRVI